MTPLAAYAARLSARPGETLRFHAAGTSGGPLTAEVVRVVNADPNPALGGVRVAPVAVPARVVGAIEPHRVPLGSHGEIALADTLEGADAVTVIVTLLCTRLPEAGGSAAVLSLTSLEETGGETGGAHPNGLLLCIDPAGRLTFETADGALLATLGPVDLDRWYRCAIVSDASAGQTIVSLDPLSDDGARTFVRTAARVPAPGPDARLMLAAGPAGAQRGTFNGRLERPVICRRALSAAEVEAAGTGASVDGLIGSWDFAIGIETDRVHDTGPLQLHGRLVNTPTRGITGSTWTGQEMSWRHAPDQYAAIHFHDDDIDDCHWPVVVEVDLPADLRSGQYALMLEAGGAKENVPFWVAAPRGRPAAKIAVLVSTFTYTVYGNHARPEWIMDPAWQRAWREQAAAWGGYPYNPGDHRDLGLSTYNVHSDGTGISIASWHRPMLNLRLGYLTYPYPEIRGSGLRHYPADSHLTQWLEAQGHDYDIITDWELHHEGLQLLEAYPVLMTGTHPEYHTRDMLDALQAYRDRGGRIAYLGGNGFYWKIALSPDKPGVIEIRRGEGGIRAWAAEPGEYYNQFDGEYGGLWRRNGRPPQRLTGVGFTAQGNFVGSHYRIRPQARSSRAGWILKGVSGETFGGHGLSGHGAAGFELDRADKRLGTPRHAVILASSEDHPPEAPWVLVPEERLTHLTTIPGAKDAELIRADMVFFETAGGAGAVFSTGSITFCGSLPTNGFANDVSTILAAVVDRFLDPAPFPLDDRDVQ